MAQSCFPAHSLGWRRNPHTPPSHWLIRRLCGTYPTRPPRSSVPIPGCRSYQVQPQNNPDHRSWGWSCHLEPCCRQSSMCQPTNSSRSSEPPHHRPCHRRPRPACAPTVSCRWCQPERSTCHSPQGWVWSCFPIPATASDRPTGYFRPRSGRDRIAGPERCRQSCDPRHRTNRSESAPAQNPRPRRQLTDGCLLPHLTKWRQAHHRW